MKLEKVLIAKGTIYISLLSKKKITCSEIGHFTKSFGKLPYFDSTN